jgi:PKD repeat protein
MKNLFCIICVLAFFACTKKKGGSDERNNSPTATLLAEMTSANPFTFKFSTTVADQEFDPVTYTWDFGNGTTKQGTAQETTTYEADKEYTVKVTVTDGKSAPTTTSLWCATGILEQRAVHI